MGPEVGAFLAVGLILSLFPLLTFILAIVALRKVGKLRARIETLEGELRRGAPLAVQPVPVAAPVPAPPPAPAPAPPPIAIAPPTSAPAPIAVAPTPAPAPLAAARTAPPPPTRAAGSPSGLEERIGGIWLQNVGSVLLLLGSFFLILWGYTQGKIGPEILILAGVALGAVLAWRGDVIAKTIRPWGHALLGVGLGVVYITIYLGHFQMRALPPWPTLGLLVLVSFITIDLGLRRAQPIIAALGVFGAFVPLLLSVLPEIGFRLPSGMMLGYLILVNAVFIVLTALRGWSGLCLLALILTPIAWINNSWAAAPTLDIELGLCGLFAALGLAPAVRLGRAPGPVKMSDIATTTSAPLFLLVVSAPFFDVATRTTSGLVLGAMGALYFLAAIWVDSRRPERDLWKPITGAGVVFITAALERLLAARDLGLAWSVEGAVLVWLGMGSRGGWFRALGYAVSIIAVLRMVFFPSDYNPYVADTGIGLVNGAALRDLMSILVMIVASDRISRRREHLSVLEAFVPAATLIVVNLLVMIWIGREARFFAPLLAVRSIYARATIDGSSLTVAAWALQMTVLVLLSRISRSPAHRRVAYGVASVAFLVFVVVVAFSFGLQRREWIEAYPTASILLVAVALFFLSARLLWSQRDQAPFPPLERVAPEIAVSLANAALMLWSAREASDLAWRLAPGTSLGAASSDAPILTAVVMSAMWVLQAGVLFALGWIRRSAFYRWLALAIVAITLLKFAFFDLQRVDVFWRFVIALGIGAALLVVSFVYQRAQRARRVAAP